MADTTTKGFPYPEGTDVVDVAGDIQALAEAVDDMPGVQSYTGTEISNLTAGEKWAGRIVWNSTTGKLQVSNGSTFSDVDTSLALASTNPAALGVAAPGNGTTAARDNHVHAMPSASDVGAVANSLITNGGKGALVTTNGTAVTALGVGTNGQVLVADSAASNGIKWDDASGGGPIVSHYFTDGQGSVTVTVPVGKYLVTTDADDTVVTVGSDSVTGKGPQVLAVSSTGSSFGVSRPQIPGAGIEPTTWTTRTSGFGATQINALTYGTVYVAGGNAGTLTTSTDAVTWTTRTSGFGATNIRTVTFGNGVYVAGGAAGTLTSSTDAVTWTTRTSNFSSSDIRAMTFGNGVYVAGGLDGKIATSTDGTTWTTRTSGFGALGILALAFGNGVYLAGGGESALTTSTDGTTWTTRTSGFTGGNQVFALVFGNGVYVAGGAAGTLTSSTDAVTWTTRTSGFGASAVQALTFGNGVFIAGGAGGTVTTSTDAVTWTTRTSGFGATTINALTFGNGVYVAGGVSGTMTTAEASNAAGTDQPTGVVVHALTDVA